MTALGLPHGLGRLPSRLHSLLWRTQSHIPTVTLKPFSTSLSEETPAMKALKSIPYPSTPLDSSLFEPWGRDYASIDVPEANPSKLGPDEPSRLLRQLVSSRNFTDAEHAHAELVEMGIDIKLSPVYYHAAQHVLEQKEHDDRANAFAKWWSLIPLQSDNPHGTFFSVERLLYSTGDVRLDCVSRFAVIGASKGYARQIGARAVAHILRYAQPSYSAQFLSDLSHADSEYQNKSGQLSEGLTRLKENRKRWWSLAVRTHCTAGRPDAALALTRMARERSITLTFYTYQYLLGKLVQVGNAEGAEEVRTFHDGTIPVAKSLLDTPSGFKPLPLISPANDLHTNEAIVMTMLKRSAITDEPAYARDMVPFFDLYKLDRRGGHAIMHLRTRAYRFSLSALSIVLLAEMLHHHGRKEYIGVLYVFSNFFHMVGVPARVVRARLWTWRDYQPKDRIGSDLPRRIKLSTFNLRSKLWPTSYHTALVWNALVHLCNVRREVDWLYNNLMHRTQPPDHERIRWSKGVESISATNTTNEASPHPVETDPEFDIAPTQAYDAAHYHPFIWAYSFYTGAGHALDVLDDMEQLGVKPSFNNLTLAAGLQAKYGSEKATFNLLDHIERLCAEELQDTQKPAPKSDEEPWKSRLDEGLTIKDFREDSLLLIAYTTVLRGFVDRRRLPSAREVEQRLYDRLQYKPGTNRRTDEALRWLRDLESGVSIPGQRWSPLPDAPRFSDRTLRSTESPSPESAEAFEQ
ncbi:hypothetical protein BV25DRAFT_1823391 [Artomyces pyxidatus]|uniref:Uncharacterized protein n=1 Tax=Artomyces pyxidatus TaxID=48021 RepID=A0ACB8T8U7_9AGAM|nr:hypothetical protein BV25DRAFT_1823391 [Artomyces pyxidatus]